MRLGPWRNSAPALVSRVRVGGARSAFPWIALAPWLVAGPLACGDSFDVGASRSQSAEPSGSSRAAIYAGVIDNDSSANPAVIALRVGNGSPFELCSGALIAPNVVLTAHHCVGQVLTSVVSCNQNGQSLNGNQIGADLDPTTMHVYTGAQPNLLGTPAANGKAIFHPSGGSLCNSDFAVLVLDAIVTQIVPLRVRLVDATSTTDQVRAVGYGQNDQSQPIGTRFRKDSIALLAAGPQVSPSGTALASNEFEVGLSICEGDSGSPAISESTGAIIGLASRGGACTDTSGHVYTETKGFADIFQQAFAVAGGSVTEEHSPPPAAAEPDAGTSPDAGGPNPPTPPPPEAGTDPGSAQPPMNLRSGAGQASCSLAPARGRPPFPLLGIVALTLSVRLAQRVARRRRRRTGSEPT